MPADHVEQRIHAGHRLEINATPLPAITPIGATLRDKLLPPHGTTTIAAITGENLNISAIDKHFKLLLSEQKKASEKILTDPPAKTDSHVRHCISIAVRLFLESKDDGPDKGILMVHSTLTSKGQTTIPSEIRAGLKIKPGDRIEYVFKGDHAIIRVHPGLMSLAGSLKSDKGKGMSFAQIRKAAAAADLRKGLRWQRGGS
jgi:antitoxin PrlF